MTAPGHPRDYDHLFKLLIIGDSGEWTRDWTHCIGGWVSDWVVFRCRQEFTAPPLRGQHLLPYVTRPIQQLPGRLFVRFQPTTSQPSAWTSKSGQ